MHEKLKNHPKELSNIDWQRKAWLVLSAFVVVCVGFIIFDASRLRDLHIFWTVGTLGIVLATVWWYWAMRTINRMLIHRNEELEVLNELCITVKEIKVDILKEYKKDVD